MKNKNFQKFVQLLPKLNEIEILGLMKILNVQIVDEEKEPIAAEVFLQQALHKFNNLNRNQQRTLLKVITGKIK